MLFKVAHAISKSSSLLRSKSDTIARKVAGSTGGQYLDLSTGQCILSVIGALYYEPLAYPGARHGPPFLHAVFQFGGFALVGGAGGIFML